MKLPSRQLGVVLPPQPGEAHRNGGRLVDRGDELIHICDVLNNDNNSNDNDNMDLLNNNRGLTNEQWIRAMEFNHDLSSF